MKQYVSHKSGSSLKVAFDQIKKLRMLALCIFLFTHLNINEAKGDDLQTEEQCRSVIHSAAFQHKACNNHVSINTEDDSDSSFGVSIGTIQHIYRLEKQSRYKDRMEDNNGEMWEAYPPEEKLIDTSPVQLIFTMLMPPSSVRPVIEDKYRTTAPHLQEFKKEHFTGFLNNIENRPDDFISSHYPPLNNMAPFVSLIHNRYTLAGIMTKVGKSTYGLTKSLHVQITCHCKALFIECPYLEREQQRPQPSLNKSVWSTLLSLLICANRQVHSHQ